MNRSILGIGAFILTFGISTSLVGLFFGFPKLDPSHSHDHGAKTKIMRVLDRDINYGELRRNDVVRLARENQAKGITIEETQLTGEFAVITERYVEDLSAINTSGTPADFAYAWNEHVAAWNARVKFLKSVNDHKGETPVLSEDEDRISDTYFQALRIAKRYGAPMRARYFR